MGRGLATVYAGRKVPVLGICKELDIWGQSDLPGRGMVCAKFSAPSLVILFLGARLSFFVHGE